MKLQADSSQFLCLQFHYTHLKIKTWASEIYSEQFSKMQQNNRAIKRAARTYIQSNSYATIKGARNNRPKQGSSIIIIRIYYGAAQPVLSSALQYNNVIVDSANYS